MPNVESNLVRVLCITTCVNLVLGIGCCVAAGFKWDRRTPLRFKHAGGDARGFQHTSYRSDISVVFALAAINLLATVWPIVCLIGKWRSSDTAIWAMYKNNVEQKSINPYRWLEFMLSAPLVVLVCAIALGCNDFMFLLAQMTITVAVIIIGYGHEREKLFFSSDKNLFLWFPISSAIAIFGSQWALILWNAYEARAFARVTAHWGWAPFASFAVGAGCTLHVMACTSNYLTKRFNGVFKPMNHTTAETYAQIVSCLTRVSVTVAYIPLIKRL
jgi:hypothetical protein